MSMRYPGGFIASTPVTAGYPSGVWTQAQAIPYQAQNVWTRDQYWPYTTLLLQGNGTNGAQNNTFLDSSSNNFTITRNGNTTQGSFTPYEQDGYWSNYFDGSGDYLTTASSPTASGDFTYEAWVFPVATGGLILVNGSEATNRANLFLSSSQQLSWGIFGVADYTLGGSVPLNQWTHVALVRSGTTVTGYVNGIAAPTTTTYSGVAGNANGFSVGANRTGGSPFTGYISNVRVLTGTALYTSNFTPSAAPLTAITNTSLLTCQSNRFIDNSTNAFTITRNGDVSVQAFQPFPGATTYSGTVLGGSGYFDGSGDYLGVPSGAFSYTSGNAYTCELWIYPTSYPTQYANLITVAGTTSNVFSLYIENNGMIAVSRTDIGDVIASAAGAIRLRQWNHIAIGKNSSNSARIWVNGASVASGTDATNYTVAGNNVGSNTSGSAIFAGFISGLRSVTGSDVYGVGNTSITVPTSPPTAITNTSLLLNFTNAGIFDAAVMNDLETVGNAQVSTSVVKYGTGSMAFDGTSNCRVQVSSNVAPVSLNMGTGDYTVELWMYAGTPGSQQTIFDFRNADVSGQGVALSYSTSRTLFVYMLANRITSSPIAANTWTHVAVVRANGIYTLYVNGLSAGTWANSDAVVPPANRPYIGAVNDGSQVFNGYIDDFRITRAARYLTSFTPPPARMPGQ